MRNKISFRSIAMIHIPWIFVVLGLSMPCHLRRASRPIERDVSYWTKKQAVFTLTTRPWVTLLKVSGSDSGFPLLNV
ncbi:hypothetical protein JOM56_015245 [Amanita muscaria]